jgi:ribosomal protein L6P/L9E
MKTIINFSDFDQVKLGHINNQTVVILNKENSSFYLSIPKLLKYTILDSSIEVTFDSNEHLSLFNTFTNLLTQIKSNSTQSKKKIILKGLGFRSTFEDLNKSLSFKLGYSHMSNLNVPDFIKNIKIKKNTLLLEASDKILLGDYVKRIHELKKSDIYKGKGFSFQYENKKLKTIKKK